MSLKVKMRLLLFLFAFVVKADIYLQFPPGANNRLDDENRDRNNANRMCDTQNNNRGGYNVGNVFYYANTKVPMKWSAQHSCGNPNANCDIIIQMMCDKNLRDGTTTKTIPENSIECYNWDCDTDVRYGRHESFEYYQTCKKTQRNTGLFLADQTLKGTTAKYTRQNPNGARRGYECPEERDYYPYWRPTPWVDIAYLTNNFPKRCAAVIKESANKNPRFYCKLKDRFLYAKNPVIPNGLPIDKDSCDSLKITVPVMVPVVDPTTGNPILTDGKETMIESKAKDANGNPTGKTITKEVYAGEWTTYKDATRDRLAAAVGDPICLENTWSRDNHHGNVKGGDFTQFEWTVPDIAAENCVLRIRYNISTSDLPAFNDDLTTADLLDKDGKLDKKGMYYVGGEMGFNMTETKMSGYYFKENPQVAPFYNWGGRDAKQADAFTIGTTDTALLKFQLAIDTAQFGRTFQDRTHRFSIRSRNAAQAGAVIHNLNVRGKRGNIVQTYPGTEYSFVPEVLKIKQGDLVHTQWVGSNTNPNNNAGQGRQGSDRHNIATLRARNYMEQGQPDPIANKIFGQFGNSYPAHLEKQPFLGFSNRDRQMLAILKGVNTNGGELSELDDSGTYANFKLMKATETGFYNYLCTRNNNFSNRSQKGQVEVTESMARVTKASFSGAIVEEAGAAQLIVGGGAQTTSIVTLEIVGEPNAGWCDVCMSKYIEVSNLPVTTEQSWLKIDYTEESAYTPAVYHTTENSIGTQNWQKIESASCSDGICKVPLSSNAAGIYVVDNALDWWPILLAVIFGVMVVGGIGFVVYKLKG